MKMKIEIKKYLLALALILLISLGIDSNQRYTIEGSVDSQNWEKDENEQEMCQIVMASPVGKGEYKGSIEYEAREAGSWKILDMDKNNGENQLGRVIASGEIQSGSNRLDFQFILEEKTDDLEIKVYSQDGDITVTSWKMENIDDGYKDIIFVFLCFAVLVGSLFLLKGSHEGRQWIPVLLMGVLLSVPMFGEEIYMGDDIYFHMDRITGIAEALSEGQFPVRMNYAFNHGYGFINPILYPELFIYIPAILCMLGCSAMTSYKIFILLLNLAAAFVGYYSFKHLFHDNRKGLLCTLFYLLIPYRIANVYTRAAIGEALAAIFLPLLLLGLYELLFRDSKKWYLTVIAATGIVQSHILSVEISVFWAVLAFLIAVPGIVRKKEWNRIGGAVKAGVIVIGINIWFLIPFLDQFGKDYFLLSTRQELYQNALTLWDIFISLGVVPLPRTLSFSMLMGILAFIYYYYKKKIRDEEKKLGIVCLIFGCISCYMTSIYFPWRLIQKSEIGNKTFGSIQFPWRLLGFAAVFLSVVLTMAAVKLWEERKKGLVYCLIIISFAGAVQTMDKRFEASELYMRNRDDVVLSAEYKDYYKDEAAQMAARERGDRIITDQEAEIYSYNRKGGNLLFDFTAEGKEDLYLHCPYYDYGLYRAYLDKDEIPVYTDEEGMVLLKIPKEKLSGEIEVKYVGRKLYRVGDLISLITVVLLIAVKGYCGYKRHVKKGKELEK